MKYSVAFSIMVSLYVLLAGLFVRTIGYKSLSQRPYHITPSKTERLARGKGSYG